MFEYVGREVDGSRGQGGNRPTRPWRWGWPVVLVVALVAGLLVGGGWVAWRQAHPQAVVPASVAERVPFPVYAPTRWPDGYGVKPDSFRVLENGSGVAFLVESEGGKSITVTEEPKPADFDFTVFYQQQLSAIKNLQHVPYPSVIGTTNKGQKLLSVVTDRTWLLITTSTADEAALRAIAERLRRE